MITKPTAPMQLAITRCSSRSIWPILCAGAV